MSVPERWPSPGFKSGGRFIRIYDGKAAKASGLALINLLLGVVVDAPCSFWCESGS